MHRDFLNAFFSELLVPESFADYCPNGLQIEGTERIYKIAFAVSATRDSIEQAVNIQADSLVVHHGLFWKFHGTRTLTGSFAKRVFPLVNNNINLFAYHLPLDAHPTLGNAAVLGQQIGCQQQTPFGDYKGSPTGVKGIFKHSVSAKDLRLKLQTLLAHNVILASHDETQLIRSVGIITGGANSDWVLAKKAGLDAYITGEISEHDWHESQESQVHMFAGGHAATEKGGILSLMKHVQTQCKLDCVFIDSENPA
ncbi:MAG: Nif3-like dinuclear metal center hexameric protein [Methylococcaceae bacterium]